MGRTKGATTARTRGESQVKIPARRLRGVIGWLESAIAGNSVAPPHSTENAQERLHAMTLGLSRALGLLGAFLPDDETPGLFDAAPTETAATPPPPARTRKPVPAAVPAGAAAGVEGDTF